MEKQNTVFARMTEIFRDSKTLEVSLPCEISKGSLIFSIQVRGKKDRFTTLTLPIDYQFLGRNYILNRNDDFLVLQVLDILFNENSISKIKDDRYKMPFDLLETYLDVLGEKLGITKDNSLKVEILSNIPLGSSKFKLDYRLFTKRWGYISSFYKRQGRVQKVDSENSILLSDKESHLLELLANPPLNADDQFIYVARIKKLASQVGATIDGFIKNEEYLYIEDVGADVSPDSTLDSIEIEPVFNDIDDSRKEAAKLALRPGNRYGHIKEDNKKIRVFTSQEATETMQKLDQKRSYRGVEVPKLLENPANFLPETIDLEAFSERVKGLTKKIYRAQPFVSASTKDRNWFDIETGVKLLPIDQYSNEEPSDTQPMSTDVFETLALEAEENDSDYVFTGSEWIKLPEEYTDFIKATKRIDKEFKAPDSLISVDLTRLGYILDIFENIDSLEYSAGLIEFKQKKTDLLWEDLPKGLSPHLTLYPHQKTGYLWLRRLQQNKLGGLLADDMGLGKTLQVILLLAKLKEEEILRPALIVVPNAVRDNWHKEIKKFAPRIGPILIHHGSYRSKDPESFMQSDVVITTYGTLTRDQLLLAPIPWSVVVCDEAQRIKNQSTYCSRAVKALKSNMRLALTGTPVENSLDDLWSIMDFSQPGLLGSLTDFRNQFAVPLEGCSLLERKSIENRLTHQINPVYLRRLKEDELKDKLPPIRRRIIHNQMSALQIEKYQHIQSLCKKDKKQVLKYLPKLFDVCSHPRILTDDWPTVKTNQLLKESPKLNWTITKLREIKAKGEKVAIFVRRRKMQLILHRVLTDLFELSSVPIINGDVLNRLEIIDRFGAKPGFGVIILSPHAAGVGLNIVCCNHVIHFARWWNPATEQQATDRIYRIGQTLPVDIFIPISTSPKFTTVEEKLAELLSEKTDLARSIIIPSSELENQIVKELNNMVLAN